jgi:hypothetical protein
MRTDFNLISRRCAAVAVVLVGHAFAQQSDEIKVPHPLPDMHPTKAPAAAPAGAHERPIECTPRETAHHPAADRQTKPGLSENPALLRPPHDPGAVDFAEPGDGLIWVHGATYKASFGASGVQYIPYLGARAPRNYPVSFVLQSIAVGGQPVAFASSVSASRTDHTIVLDRGGVIENYQMAPDGMEQMFVFDSLPRGDDRGGDLVVRMGVETELPAAESAEGFRFSNDLGYVSYGRAQAYDAGGDRTPATAILDGDAIEIRVPAAFLASAVFPVTIDPFVSSFGIDASSYDDLRPDVAYDATNDRYIVVYEEAFSGSDHDVFSAFVFPGGGTISGHYIDSTSDFWGWPKVANNNIAHNFLVVADVSPYGGNGPFAVRGATVAAAPGGIVGPQFTISLGAQGADSFWADVGGDPTTAPPTYYLVTWETAYSSTDHDIYARLVDASGALQGSGPIYVDFSTSDDDVPRISKSDGHAPFNTQRWTIVWSRYDASTNSNYPWGAQYLWDGSLVHPTFLIDSAAQLYSPAVPSSLLDGAAGERDFLVAYSAYYPGSGSNDVFAEIFNGTTFVSAADISVLEGQGFPAQSQSTLGVDSDGSSFAIVYQEHFGGSSSSWQDIYVAAVARNGNSMQVAERHVSFDFSGSYADVYPPPHITSAYSGGGAQHRFMLVWADYGSGGEDVLGGFYDAGTFATFCSPTGSFFDQVVSCPCANAPSAPGRGCNNSSATGGAQLTATGTASLSGDTVGFTSSGEKPTATSVFVQGTSPVFSGAVFGQGVRCVGGSLKRLYVHTAAGGAVSAPVGTDAHVHTRSAALGDSIAAGSARYYLVYYRDSTVLGGCPATSTFNTTQSGSLIWYP